MTTDRINQGTVTAVRIPPRATRAPMPVFIPLLPSLSLSFSDVSDGPHSSCTRGARWRGDAPSLEWCAWTARARARGEPNAQN